MHHGLIFVAVSYRHNGLSVHVYLSVCMSVCQINAGSGIESKLWCGLLSTIGWSRD